MKRIVIVVLIGIKSCLAGIWVSPGFVGNGSTDSVIVSFCTFDTTFYPRIADADSVIALRYGPTNTLVDSLTQISTNLFKVRKGWYEIHYRGSNGSASMGNYRVYVRVRIGGDWRGAASVNYRVIDDEVGNYLSKLSADGDSLKDTLGLLLHLPDTARIARAAWSDNVVARKDRRIGWGDTVNVVNSAPGGGGSGVGSGAYACTLFVTESSSGSAVQGVFLRVMNSTETATAATRTTNSNGRAIFSLDAATYKVFPYLTGYNFAALPQSVQVSSSGANDTLSATQFSPGESPMASLCRVYGYVKLLNAENLAEVAVMARIQNSPLLYQGAVISPYAVSTITDSTGYWYLDLYANSKLSPAGTKYDFSFYYPSGTILRRQITVPDSVSFWFRW